LACQEVYSAHRVAGEKKEGRRYKHRTGAIGRRGHKNGENFKVQGLSGTLSVREIVALQLIKLIIGCAVCACMKERKRGNILF